MKQKACIALLFLLLCLAGLNAVENSRNPYKAMLFSAVIPGAGQVYNGSWLKAGAVVGLQAYLINSALYNFDRREHYNDLINDSETSTDPYYQSRKNVYDDRLRSDYWWIGTVLALSVADAFVDAHLHNFDKEKKNIRLKFGGGGLELQLGF